MRDLAAQPILFQQGKGQAGLDQHQLRLWHSFHRHTVLSMCALALLAVATARPPGTPVSWAPPGMAAAPQADGAGATGQPEHCATPASSLSAPPTSHPATPA